MLWFEMVECRLEKWNNHNRQANVISRGAYQTDFCKNQKRKKNNIYELQTLKVYEKTKKAVVNLVTSVDYVVDAIINKDGQGSLNRSYTSTQNTITVYNFSIFDELTNGDAVILVHPQEGYSSNYFIIGVLKPEMFSSLIDKVKTLKEENKNRQTEIEQLRQRVTSLENQVQQLWNAVNKMSSTT